MVVREVEDGCAEQRERGWKKVPRRQVNYLPWTHCRRAWGHFVKEQHGAQRGVSARARRQGSANSVCSFATRTTQCHCCKTRPEDATKTISKKGEDG